MIVTDRDRKVIDFISNMNCVNTNIIYELFYPSLRVAQNRLKLMYDNKILKRDRDHFTNQFYYYIDNKPKQVNHNLILAKFYNKLSKTAKIVTFKKEYSIGDVRSDALVIYSRGNKSYIAFIEVELSNTPDIWKYEKLYKSGEYKKHFNEVFPLIMYITNKNIPKTNLKIVKINEDIEDIRGIII